MRTGRCGLLSAAVLGLLLASSTALAQDKLTFDIPSQPAAAAIRSWAQQSGLQVFASEEHLRGVRTNEVRGLYMPVEAVQLMVENTGLEVVATGEKTVTIRRPNGGGQQETADRPF